MTSLRSAGRQIVRLRTITWRLTFIVVVLTLGLSPGLSAFNPEVALAQAELTAEPKAVSPAPTDLRAGFQLVPEKSEQREPVPGILVYEADFVRDQTPKNFSDGPIEIKSLVAKTASSQQATEQFTSSRQALTTASPPWSESTVAKLGDEATGLTMEGTSSEGPAVAHLFLFRRGTMVIGITVAGLKKPTKMAEAEAIAAIVLKKLDPTVATQSGPKVARPLNTQRPPSRTAASTAASSPSAGTTQQLSNSTGPKVRVANTGGTGVRMRATPSKTGQIAQVLPEGTVLDIVGDDKQAEGLTWRNVRASGDGRGWVDGEYLVAVAGSPTTTTAAASPAASPTTRASTPASAPSAAPASSSSSSSTTDALKVEVSVGTPQLKAGSEQTVNITVTKGGQPVAGAQVTVKTSPTGETPTASATDAQGKATVTWKPTGSPGFIGVGVSVLSSDGGAGVGGASFQLSAS